MTVLLIAGVAWLTRSVGYFNYITNYGLNLTDFIKIISCFLPNILVLIIPLCSSMATIIYYTKVSQNNELVILRSSGLNKKQLIISPFFNAILACIISYFIMFNIVPKTNLVFENVRELIRKNFVNVLVSGSGFKSFNNFRFYLKEVEGNKLKSLVVFVGDLNNGDKLVYSEDAEVINEDFLKLNNGSMYYLDKNKNNSITKTVFFDEYIIKIKDFFPDNNINKYNNNIEFLTIRKLLSLKKKNTEVISEIMYRFMNPLLPLVLSLLSATLILNINFSRNEKNIGSLLIFALDLIIFAIFTYSYNLAKKNIFGIYVMLFSILLPIIYIIIDIVRDDRKNFTK